MSIPRDKDKSSPPPAKRYKSRDGDPVPIESRGGAAKDPMKRAEFPVHHLEDFYKPCPSYRLPMEVGAFSLDSEGKLVLDRSQLKYYTPPSRLNFDLKVGFDSFVPKKESVPANKLRPILSWISSNGDAFRPRSQPKSPDMVAPEQSINGNENKERPDNLMTNFVTWRGMVTKLLCSPYNKTEPWRMAATLHNGTIYLSEIEMDESREREANMSSRHEQMCYWGVKFEDYMTSKTPPTAGRPATPSTPASKTGTVNPKEAFCTVVRTRMNTHSVVMAGEVDCCDHMSKEKPPQSYVELKTSRMLYTDRNKSSFKRYKLMKWWAQSFLVGVPRVICGFRDDEGIVKNLQTFKTAEIPHDTQTDLTMWQPSVCLNFLDELLTWIRKTVINDNPRVVYVLEWSSPYNQVACTELLPGSEHVFLPEWYVSKLPPPSDE